MFDLTSEEYTRDYNEVKRVGALNAEALGNRTPEQSAVARFWPGGGANWNAVLRVIVANRGLDEWQLARLFALDNMAQTDAAIAVFDTKFTYNFWRPVTAIRYAGDDGNPATTPGFRLALVSEHAAVSRLHVRADDECGRRHRGAAPLLRHRRYRLHAHGRRHHENVYEPVASIGGCCRCARVRRHALPHGCVHGVRQGEQVGRFVFQHELRPVKGATEKRIVRTRYVSGS